MEIGSTEFIRYLALEGKGDCPPCSGEWWYELGQLKCPFWNAPSHWILSGNRSFRLSFQKAVHNLGAEIRKETTFGDADLGVVATMIMCLTNFPLLGKWGPQPLHFKLTSLFEPRPCTSQVASSQWVSAEEIVKQISLGRQRTPLSANCGSRTHKQLFWTLLWLQCSHPNFFLPSLSSLSASLDITFASGLIYLVAFGGGSLPTFFSTAISHQPKKSFPI